MDPQLLLRTEEGLELPYLVWRLPTPCRVVSSAILGGGIGTRGWILNAQVQAGYGRLDPAGHLTELATAIDLHGAGVGLLTAADVDAWQSASDEGARVDATVGVRVPTWAASAAEVPDRTFTPGTINIVAFVPEPMADGALINLVATVTEAKTQALLDAGVPGTGTATDAVCIVAPMVERDRLDHAVLEPFGGPRSRWGSRLARATHPAVAAGPTGSVERHDRSDGAAADDPLADAER
jgi:adenosylcobinamide amidohydrolase